MSERTEISEIGEFGLIGRIREMAHIVNKSTIQGIGDDAAVIENGQDFLVVSTDALVENVHFDLGYVPLKHLGYKAMAVNFSDIAAMNGVPQQVVVALGLSNRFSVEAVEELYEGMRLACEKYGVDLVGGDTTTSRSGLFMSITVLGKVAKDKIAYRKGAQEKELICVTGDLGAAYMGLQVLEREKQVFQANPEMQPDLEGKDYIIQRQLKPEPRVDVVKELARLGVKPTSMIDVSDGLASEILHLCKASGLGARIYEEKLPIDRLTYEVAREFELDPVTVQLNGGEDYELLFTMAQEDYEKLRNHPDISVIGYMEAAGSTPVMVTKQGNEIPLQAQGWKHF